MTDTHDTRPSAEDFAYQARILQGVSRTFALTIPQLPEGLATVVSNAYLLCRIADTIEDDKDMDFAAKKIHAGRFIAVVAAGESAADFARDLHPQLSASASADERDLVENAAPVLRITHSFNPRQRQALERCIRLMADGMAEYQATNVSKGLKNQADMDRYCYYVAGVVGEMLTELFCDHSPLINHQRETLMALAVSFGQGLQMTNILKDIWEDQGRDMCWLPRDIFEQHGLDLGNLSAARGTPAFRQAMHHLIGIARSHLVNALHYTLLIPARETGIRRFCLWALGMAVLTLRKIHDNPDFIAGRQVKISRRSVKATIFVSNLFTGQDFILKTLFRLAAAPLPATRLADRFQAVSDTG